MTNVLSHDQHYRHVARLWNSWLSTLQSNGIKPKDIFQRNREVASSYTRYCVDLIKRTLLELGFEGIDDDCFNREGVGNVSISVNGYSEIVLFSQISTLYFIPISCDAIIDNNAFANKENQSVLMCLHRNTADYKGSLWCAPTNFYSLEAVAKLLIEWFMKETYKPLVTNIKNIPKLLVEDLETLNAGHWIFNSSSVMILKPFLSLNHRFKKY